MRYLSRLAIGCLLVGLCGSVYERMSERRDRTRLPQIGRSVSIGGRSLNIFCSGEGTPVVVFDSGGGMPGLSWVAVQHDVSRFTRACWYDRAGYGWSDPARAPRTSADAAVDLDALLKAARVPGPYVLVGHSIGGLNVRVYAGLFRRQVAGVVLVDASHEDVDQRIPRGRPRVALPASLRPAFDASMAFASATGFLRISSRGALAGVAQPATIASSEWVLVQRLAALPKTVQASATEWFTRSAEQARAAGGLGNLPVLVLTAGRFAQDDQDATDDHHAWVELQSELARLSTHARQVIVADSGHLMPFDSPGAIVSATLEIVTEVRSSALPSPF
jgi:pimeloyl-ACP methyl ester carboxylesterase